MDATSKQLVDYAFETDYRHLSQDTVHECKRRLIDTFACAVGAYHDPVCDMARRIAARHSGTPSATVWGSSLQTTPDTAAFTNGVMLRFLDMSDTYRVKCGGHPSDIFAGVLAVGEATHADGASGIGAATLAYDVYCTFCEAVALDDKGWDQPVYGVIASAIGAGKLLGLTREQMSHAISLALVPNMALYQTRRGSLSSWKGCAAANAARNGVFAAVLAQEGFTGPEAPFEGKDGLYDVIGRFDWKLPGTSGQNVHRIERTNLKCFPVCAHGQAAVSAALEVRGHIREEEVNEILVETFRVAVAMMANDPTKWAPETRETADHSLPYVVSVALRDGEVTSRSFAHEKLSDASTIELMRKVRVTEDPALSELHPEANPCRVTVRTAAGRSIERLISYPKGHINNPFSDNDLEHKFSDMFVGFGSKQQCSAVLAGLWKFDAATDVADVLQLLVAQQ